MSSYDADSVRNMRPRNWLETFVAQYVPSRADRRAAMLKECQYQSDLAMAKRKEFHSNRRPANATSYYSGGYAGVPKDAYVEREYAALVKKRELEAKKKEERAAQGLTDDEEEE